MTGNIDQTFAAILHAMRKWLAGLFVLMACMSESCRKSCDENVVDPATEQPIIPPVSNVDSSLVQLSDSVLLWLDSMQLDNGLVETSYQSNLISLYDNALTACAFISAGQHERAARILDFFNARLNSEMLSGNGGYFQFRSASGPQGNRWLGDNAWLLIAIHNYEHATGDYQFAEMRQALDTWIRAQQDVDGGLWGGTDATGATIGKITEGIIDAFNAVQGFDAFHEGVLEYLEQERWDTAEQLFVSWPGSNYYYALDNFSWGYCTFEGFPDRMLQDADRFLNTQTHAPNQQDVNGYCFDEDRDAVWLEGTAQMAVAYTKAGHSEMANSILQEVAKTRLTQAGWSGARGIPYATNQGTGYGGGLLWDGIDTQAATAASTWFIMACNEFDPMRVGYEKGIPQNLKFW
jgi:hypothetical protein